MLPFKSQRAESCEAHPATEVAAINFADRLAVVVSQSDSLGSVMDVVASATQDSFSHEQDGITVAVRVLLGDRENVVMRAYATGIGRAARAAGVTSPVVAFLAIKNEDPEAYSALAPVIRSVIAQSVNPAAAAGAAAAAAAAVNPAAAAAAGAAPAAAAAASGSAPGDAKALPAPRTLTVLPTFSAAETARLNAAMTRHPDFPKPGITFVDFFPLFRDPALTDLLMDGIERWARALPAASAPDGIVGLDSRGFIFGPMLARALRVPFVPIRKKGKLPPPCHAVKYGLEYGSAELEVQVSAGEHLRAQAQLSPGSKPRVLVVDDLLATGGTLGAALHVLKATDIDVMGCLLIISLSALKGHAKVDAPVFTVFDIDDL